MSSRSPAVMATRAAGAALGLLAPLAAESGQFGDWMVERNRELVIATTRDRSDVLRNDRSARRVN